MAKTKKYTHVSFVTWAEYSAMVEELGDKAVFVDFTLENKMYILSCIKRSDILFMPIESLKWLLEKNING